MPAHPQTLDAEARRLLWRCRRGMKELDVLLERYVRSQVPGTSKRERAALEQLLELPDPVLADHLFGHTPVSDPRLASLIVAIRDCPPGADPRQAGAGLHPAAADPHQPTEAAPRQEGTDPRQGGARPLEAGEYL